MPTTKPPGRSQPQGTASSIGDAVRETAAKIGSDAKDEAMHEAEQAQRKTSESMRAFAEAIRNAGDELAGNDEGPAAQLLGQAAEGLEQLSTAVGQKRLEDIVSDVRSFGHKHPGTFMIGSVLVGIALGRFARRSVAGGTRSGDAAAGSNRRETAPADYGQTPGGRNEL